MTRKRILLVVVLLVMFGTLYYFYGGHSTPKGQPPLGGFSQGDLTGIVAWRLTGGVMFLIGGALLLANWPWTIFGIMPTNRVLMATELEAAP